MLSILVPTYNYDLSDLLTELKAQLESVETTLEVLICDDASSNAQVAAKNEQLARQFDFEYLVNESNLGRTTTRNKLAEAAKYEWLMFLDADVLPVKTDFVKLYLATLSQPCHVIAGGIAYTQSPPTDTKQRLRWNYGHKKEVKSVSQRSTCSVVDMVKTTTRRLGNRQSR